MRSTRFLVVSILLHALGVMALTLSPRSITPETSPGTVEVKIDEVNGQAGQAAMPAEEVAPVQSEPVQPEPERAAPIKAPTKKVAQSAKPKKAKLAAVAAPSEDREAPVIDTSEATEPTQEDSQQPVATNEQEPVEEKLIPIKESAPAGVEAASAEEAQPEQAKEELAQEPANPVAIATPAPKAAPTPAPAAAVVGGSAADTAKGGSTKESAVSYLDLKQMSGNRPPNYPIQARLENRQGTMELLYRVTKDGKVTDIQIAKSSGSKDLDASAVAAISNFKFVPGQEGWARHPVVFSLKGAVATIPSRLRVNSGKQAQSE